MTHDEVVTEIQARAQARGILTHYCGPGERCKGDRGMPDLILVGGSYVAWVEVKTLGDRLKSLQTRWRYALLAIGAVYRIMYEYDLRPGGAVDVMLSLVADGN